MFRQGLGRQQLLTATLWAVVTAAAFGWRGFAAFVGTVAVVLVSARFSLGRLGGLNGDVYGAIGEVCEVAVLLAGAAL